MEFSLTVLGSSSALPTAQRNPSAHLLNVNDGYYLIDCGEGTQMQLRRFRLRFQKINHIFISHMHGDHYFGLIGLLMSMILLGREKEMHLYGPKELMPILDLQMKGIPSDQRFPIVFHPLNFEQPEQIHSDKRITVTSIPLDHRMPCCGFLFREQPRPRNIRKEALAVYQVPIAQIAGIRAGEDLILENGETVANSLLTRNPPASRSFAYCSDTRYLKHLAGTVKGVDLLYHEATFGEDMADRAHHTGHSTAKQAATVAKEAGVGQLLLGHFSARYRDLEPLEKEAREVFKKSEVVEEGKTYSVKLVR